MLAKKLFKKEVKSNPKETIVLEVSYYNDFIILYSLNKDIKLKNRGAGGEARNHPNEIQNRIWDKKLIDLRKITKIWEKRRNVILTILFF